MEETKRVRKTVKPRKVIVPEPEHEAIPEATELNNEPIEGITHTIDVYLSKAQENSFAAGKPLRLTAVQINPNYNPKTGKEKHTLTLTDAGIEAIQKAIAKNAGVVLKSHHIGGTIFKHIRRIGDFIKHNVKSKHIKSLAHYAINNSGMDDANKERIKQ